MNAQNFLDCALRSVCIALAAELALRAAPRSAGERFREMLSWATLAVLVVVGLEPWLPVPRWELSLPITRTLAIPPIAPAGASLFCVLWVTGCALFVLREAAGWWRLGAIRRAAQPAEEQGWQRLLEECRLALGVSGHICLAFADAPFGPAASGLIRRCILLPEDARRWSDERARLVLLHELAHFRRGDLWLHHFARMVCVLHWFNPFAWKLQRRLAVAREHACDALVAARGIDRTSYAALLLEFAARPRCAGAASLTMAAARPSELERRIRALLEPDPPPPTAARLFALALFSLVFATAVGLTACAFIARPTSAGMVPWTVDEIQRRLAADPFPGSSGSE